jgi:2-iminobutanoate/2-iminopropanoate deaminase
MAVCFYYSLLRTYFSFVTKTMKKVLKNKNAQNFIHLYFTKIKSKMQEIIITKNAPAPIGPYNQAVKANGFLFVSGQIPAHPTTGEIVKSGIEDETTMVMKNLEAILKEAGLGFSNVVKASIFISNMDDFAKINAVYGSYFTSNFPARETVQVARLPKDVNVEISVIAVC